MLNFSFYRFFILFIWLQVYFMQKSEKNHLLLSAVVRASHRRTWREQPNNSSSRASTTSPAPASSATTKRRTPTAKGKVPIQGRLLKGPPASSYRPRTSNSWWSWCRKTWSGTTSNSLGEEAPPISAFKKRKIHMLPRSQPSSIFERWKGRLTRVKGNIKFLELLMDYRS